METLFILEEELKIKMVPRALRCESSSNCKDEIMLWNLRLGHPSFTYLKMLFPSLLKNKDVLDFKCETC